MTQRLRASLAHAFLLLCSLCFTLIATAAGADPVFVFSSSPQDPADFQSRFQGCIKQFKAAGGLAGTILSQLNRAKVTISYQKGGGDTPNPSPGRDPTGTAQYVLWDSDVTGVYAGDPKKPPKIPCAILLHELEHAARYFIGKECTGPGVTPAYIYDEEVATRAENWWLDRLRLPQRTRYDQQLLPKWAQWPSTVPVPPAPPCDRCGGAEAAAAPAACRRCTSFYQAGCIDFHGGIYSGGDHRRVANGSLRIIVGDVGYCQGRTPCEFKTCSVCPHLDTAFPEGVTVTAIATAGQDSRFARWGPGACKGQGPTCTFTAKKRSCISAQFLLTNPTAPPQSLPTIPCPDDP